MLRRFEHNQVYHPTREMVATGEELNRPVENVYFKAPDGVELNAWFYSADPDSPRRDYVILFCHGNASNISHRLDLYRVLLDMGVAVFAFDYRGYGRSKGSPNEEGTCRDAQAAYAWLRQKGYDPSQIIVHGESLGGGVAAELCLREPSAGLILHSTFTSIPDIGSELFPWLPVRWISRIRYDTHHKLPQLRIPVLVMHSRTDGLIAFHHAQRNFAAANEPKLFQEIQGTHTEPLASRDRFESGLEVFLHKITGNAVAEPVPC
jgi:fermentation-respiration switch protein FrsA (DUF1100 family)